jgi:hypothetical protein
LPERVSTRWAKAALALCNESPKGLIEVALPNIRSGAPQLAVRLSPD